MSEQTNPTKSIPMADAMIPVATRRILKAVRIFAGISRLHIVAIAALGTFTFGWLFTGRYPWFLTAVCALDWFIVNLLNRVVDLKEDHLNVISHTTSVYYYRKPLSAVGVVLLVASLVTVHVVQPAVTLLRIIGHLLGIFYNWSLLPGKRRIKELYFWKNTASGIGFIITVFGYPLAAALRENQDHLFPPGITWMTVLLTAIFFILFIQSFEILYDLRDIKGDTAAGVQTYPVVHGRKAAVFMIDTLIVGSVLILTLGYVFRVIPWRIFIMVGAPILLLAVYKHALKRQDLVAGCIRATWMGAILFCIYHLWVILDLPGAGLK